MNISRRNFIGGASAFGMGMALSGFRSALAAAACCKGAKPGIALQLYSINRFIGGYKRKDGTVVLAPAGLEKALEEVAKIGFKAVEFAGYYGHSAAELKKMLADNGLAVCGTHLPRAKFGPKEFKKTCDFELGYGNTFLAELLLLAGEVAAAGAAEDFMKMLVDYYNKAAEDCGALGCKVGLHNHMKEFELKLPDGTTYWDYFFSKTDKRVCMEQDVGWTTCAGEDPCAQFVKYPGRSITIHAKENGMGKGVKKFDAILGQPGQPGAKGVEWDRLFKATDADKVKWYVVECEKHEDSLKAVKASFEFLKAKGRV